MPDISPHAWFHPRLAELVKQAAAAGIPTETSVAVITDIMNGPAYAPANAAPEAEGWATDPGEPPGAAHEMPIPQSSTDSDQAYPTIFDPLPINPNQGFI